MESTPKSEDETPTAMHIRHPRATSGDLHHGERINTHSVGREDIEDAQPISLGWRSWLVVFITCFAIMSQVFVVTAAGSVVAFIVRDLGESALSGWVIQVCDSDAMMMSFPGRSCSDSNRYITSRPPY